MKQNDQTPLAWNVLLAGICLILFVILAGFLVCNHRAEAAESKELQREAEENSAGREKSGTSQKAESDDADNIQENGETGNAAETEKKEAAEVREMPKGISFWGDEFFTSEEDLQHSYRNKLEQLLVENGYSLAMTDKSLAGAGTLSVMKMAGIHQEELDAYISAHQEAAGGAEIPITETGIRDLTEEQLARPEVDYIPVIMMGYYGGWSKNPAELVQQQQKILDTFGKYKDKFIIIGVRPQDGSVDIPVYEQTMKDTWGDHYISTIDVCTHSANTREGQDEIGQILYEKLVNLGYIAKEQEG